MSSVLQVVIKWCWSGVKWCPYRTIDKLCECLQKCFHIVPKWCSVGAKWRQVVSIIDDMWPGWVEWVPPSVVHMVVYCLPQWSSGANCHVVKSFCQSLHFDQRLRRYVMSALRRTWRIVPLWARRRKLEVQRGATSPSRGSGNFHLKGKVINMARGKRRRNWNRWWSL